MLSSVEIDKRLSCIAALRLALRGEIPSPVRVVSIEWNTNIPIFFYYYDRPFNERDQEEVEEPFMHVDIRPIEDFEIKLIHDGSQVVNYHGDCVYARKENFTKDTPLLTREHSQCLITDLDLLLKSRKSADVIKAYRNPQLQSFGELVDFKQTIGYYLNPTSREKISTSKAIVYCGKKNQYIIPASPSMNWFETLQKELESQNLELDFDSHLYSEVNRALLGRVIPNLLAAKIMWKPYTLQIYYKDKLSDDDREDLELVWFETLAGVAEKIDLALELLAIKSTYDIPSGGSCFYLKNEPPPNL